MRLSAIYTGLLVAIAAVHAIPTGGVSYMCTSCIQYLTFMIQEAYITSHDEETPARRAFQDAEA